MNMIVASNVFAPFRSPSDISASNILRPASRCTPTPPAFTAAPARAPSFSLHHPTMVKVAVRVRVTVSIRTRSSHGRTASPRTDSDPGLGIHSIGRGRGGPSGLQWPGARSACLQLLGWRRRTEQARAAVGNRFGRVLGLARDQAAAQSGRRDKTAGLWGNCSARRRHGIGPRGS
jgi:hypothetical protein